MSEDMEKRNPEEADQREDDDVEAHKRHGGMEDKSIGATEEGPDVEAHKHGPPKAQP